MQQLSRPVRQFAALALLMIALAAVISLTAMPLSSRIASLSEQIATERTVLGRFAAVAAQREQAKELERAGRAAIESSAYLKGESEAVKTARLQTMLGELAAAKSLRLHTMRTLPVREGEELRLVGVRVQFNAEIGQLRALLHAIETNRPFLFVEGLQVRPTSPFSRLHPEQGGVLDVRLDVFGVVSQKG
jgi:general secretion pathway protein M